MHYSSIHAGRHIRPLQAGHDPGENGGLSLFSDGLLDKHEHGAEGSVDSLLRHWKNSPTTVGLSISDGLA
jgi:hypothetical protein